MPILEYQGLKPQIDSTAWVSPNATLIGDITVGPNSVIWPGAFLRAEKAPIVIGKYCTIFDGVMMFTKSEKSSIEIGNYNIIETGTCIFGSFLADYITLGENSLVLERSSIGEGAVIIAESTIAAGMIIAERAIMKGNPAAVVREQSRKDLLEQKERAEHYTEIFIKIRNRLPNLQPYALTESSVMRELIKRD
jgi:carbonic anhydrase/acetyltransferase-like protein (isoleucine patch superfamily)